jgi:hypothetical protein
MNTTTGHVVADRNELPAGVRGSYTLLPRWLRRFAEQALNGRRETTVNPKGDTPLGHFAQTRVLAAQEKRARRAAKRLGNA